MLNQFIDSLVGSQIFSSLDAAQAFHNIPIEEASQDATAFICSFGLFKFVRMHFGLKNGGAVYYKLVTQIMADLGLESVVQLGGSPGLSGAGVASTPVVGHPAETEQNIVFFRKRWIS